MPLSITTTTSGRYDDALGVDGRIRYRYRGDDPAHRDNRGLREAMRTQTPLIYFNSVEKGAYVPVWPAYIEEDHPDDLLCVVRTDAAYAFPALQGEAQRRGFAAEEGGAELQRYVNALVRQRLHQGAFRAKVLRAYTTRCTLCLLHHEELLDAAHIIPDSEEGGLPVVTNGLSLCKIHHAAYDQNIIGIDPDYEVAVRADVLREIDGPMLRYGLQEMEGRKILLPTRKNLWPDRERLEARFRRFREAG
jgi:putative restriction endonuclease